MKITLFIFNRDDPKTLFDYEAMGNQVFDGAPFDFLPWFLILYVLVVVIISINAANRVGPIAYKYLKTYFNE